MKVLVTAGPTREAIDPVRFISNRSSGKMGFAIADAFRRRGHSVRLIAGPVHLADPRGVSVERVVSADDMAAAVRGSIGWCEVLVMAAAVADWRPARQMARKCKKADGPPVLKLVPTIDILKSVAKRKGDRVFVGFAAETGRILLSEAARKLREKRLDLIVANDVLAKDAGFDVDTNRVVLLSKMHTPGHWPVMSKQKVAERLVRVVEQMFSRRQCG